MTILLLHLAVLQQFMIIGRLSGNLFLTFGAAAAGIIIALFIHEIADQSQKRQRLINELQPVILDHATFPEAITQLTERWAKETN